MKLKLALVASAIGLAAASAGAAPTKPASARLAAPAFSAKPPVADGDMGRFISLGQIAIDSDKAAKSENLNQKDRYPMTTLAASMRSDARWYFGRVSLLPPEQRSRKVFDAAFQRVEKGGDSLKFDNAMACSKRALAANNAMLDT